MSTPPGQEPRPGFTPRVDQGRPTGRGASGRPDGGYRRDDSGPRRPVPGASGRGAGGGSRDTDRDVDDYRGGGRQPGSRPSASRGAGADRDRDGASQQRRDPGYRDGREQPARRPDDRDSRTAGRPGLEGRPADERDRRERGWGGYRDRRDPRGESRSGGLQGGGYQSGGYRGNDGDRNTAGRRTGGPTFVSRSVSAAKMVKPGSGPLAAPLLRWVGSWRELRAVLVLLGVALLSMVGTIVMGRDPGFLIGFLLVVGSVIAAVGVQRRAVHKLIPLPALSYLVTTTVAGLVNDWGNLNDSKEFATSFLTWIGGGFFGLVAATVLVTLITFIRWLASKLLVSGQLPAARSAAAPSAAGPSRPGRPPSGSAIRDPWSSRPPRGDGPRRDGSPHREDAPRDRAPRDRAVPDRDPRDRAPRGNAFRDGGSRGAASQPPDRGAGASRDRDAWDDGGLREDRSTREDRNPRGAPRPDGRDRNDPRDDARRPRATGSSPPDLW